MIEMEIPKDIRKYEAKLIGPFTTRQTICFACAAILGVSIYGALETINTDIRFIVIFIAVVPFLLCGWIKPYGIPLEKFIKTAFISTVLSPKNRKYKTKNSFAQLFKENEIVQTAKIKKKKIKKAKKYKSKNKDLIAFK